MENHKEEDHDHIKDESQKEEFKKLHCRMYENKYPKVEDLVYVTKTYNNLKFIFLKFS